MPIWLLGLISSLLCAFVVIAPMIIREGGYFAMAHDFAAEEISYGMMMIDGIKSGRGLWNWAIDLGGNTIEAFSFYNIGSIFVWLTLLFPAKAFPKVMGWMLILKFAVAGATSAGFISRHTKSRWGAIIGSLLYAFSGFQCSSIVFYHFQDAVALFPLMLIGLEKLVEEGKKGYFAIACALNVLAIYVFFLGDVIFMILYFIIRYMLPERGALIKSRRDTNNAVVSAERRAFLSDAGSVWKSIGLCFTEGVIGVMISGFILIPSVVGLMGNSRLSSHLPASKWFIFTIKEYLGVVRAFFTPAEPMCYMSALKGDDWTTNSIYLPLIGATFAIAYVISKRDWISRLLVSSVVITLIPILNSAFSMFNETPYRRWFYMPALIMALASAKVAENVKQYRAKLACGISLVVLAIYMFLTRFYPVHNERGNLVINAEVYWRYIIIPVVGVAATLAILMVKKEHLKKVLLSTAITIASAGMLYLAIYNYKEISDNSWVNFHNYEGTFSENAVTYLTEIAQRQDRNVLPYRYYFNEDLGWTYNGPDYTYYNFAMTNSLPSINSFLSTVHPSIMHYYEDIGLGRKTWTRASNRGSFELLGARYIISKKPYDCYRYVDTLESLEGQVWYVYENENALPIGFTYDTYLLRSEFEQYPMEFRQNIMLHTLVIDDEDEVQVSKVLRHYDIEMDGAFEDIEENDATNSQLIEAVSARSQEISSDFVTGKNNFSYKINASSDKYAFMSVPYDKHWKATVNGQAADIISVCDLMAVPVSDGENLVEMSYDYTPLRLGGAMTVVGALLLLVYVIFCKVRKGNIQHVPSKMA